MEVFVVVKVDVEASITDASDSSIAYTDPPRPDALQLVKGM